MGGPEWRHLPGKIWGGYAADAARAQSVDGSEKTNHLPP